MTLRFLRVDSRCDGRHEQIQVRVDDGQFRGIQHREPRPACSRSMSRPTAAWWGVYCMQKIVWKLWTEFGQHLCAQPRDHQRHRQSIRINTKPGAVPGHRCSGLIPLLAATAAALKPAPNSAAAAHTARQCMFPAQVMLSGCNPQRLLALREALTAVMARRQTSAPGRPPLAAVSNVMQARDKLCEWCPACCCASPQLHQAYHGSLRSFGRVDVRGTLCCH